MGGNRHLVEGAKAKPVSLSLICGHGIPCRHLRGVVAVLLGFAAELYEGGGVVRGIAGQKYTSVAVGCGLPCPVCPRGCGMQGGDRHVGVRDPA